MSLNSLSSFLFVGLGNPGSRYEMTRHNMGYLVLQAWAKQQGWSFKEEKNFVAQVAKGYLDQQAVSLLLPLTYMNLSGLAVKRYMDYFKIPVPHLVVITDDIALAFGQLRLKMQGGAGGHNGLKNIEAHIGAHYMRLRMGIGHPGQRPLVDYVLDSFSPLEKQILPAFIGYGIETLQRLLKEDPSRVMNQVNAVSPSLEKPNDLTKPPL